MNIKKIIKGIFTIVIIIVSFLGIIDLFKPDSFALKIVSQPSDALVTVGANKSTGSFKMKLKRANYTVKVEKDGYITETRQINLNKNTELEITLTSLFANSVDAEKIIPLDLPTLSNPLTDASGIIIGINNANGNLIRVANGKTQTIYSGVIKDYFFNNNLIAILDDNDLENIILLNSITLERRRINLPQLAPIVSVTLSQDNQTVYFLGEFDIERKTPSLHSISVNGGEPKKLLETRSLYVENLNNNLLLLFEDAHDFGKNAIHFYDTENEVQILTINADFYFPSPDKKHLLTLSENQAVVYNLDDFKPQTVFTGGGSRALWLDNNSVMLFKNDENGINIATLTINPLKLSPFSVLIKGTAVQKVYGVVGNKLFLQDYNNKVLSIDLP